MNIWDENQTPVSGRCLIYMHFLKITFLYEEKTWKGRNFSCLEHQLSQAQQNSCCETLLEVLSGLWCHAVTYKEGNML